MQRGDTVDAARAPDAQRPNGVLPPPIARESRVPTVSVVTHMMVELVQRRRVADGQQESKAQHRRSDEDVKARVGASRSSAGPGENYPLTWNQVRQ